MSTIKDGGKISEAAVKMLKKSRIKGERVFCFVETRSMIRDRLRRQYGNKGMRKAWMQYQRENRGKPKLNTFTKTVTV